MSRKVIVLFAALLLPALPAAQAQNNEKPVVAVFSLAGEVVETPAEEELFFSAGSRESLKDLVERLEKARDDKAVKAVVLLKGDASLGYAQIEELRRVIGELRKADKTVYAHADSLMMGDYVLLSGASQLSVVPTGDLFIYGIYGEQPYLRGLLDIVGVKPDYLTCGDYKSAAEMFLRKEPSPEAAEMYEWLYDGIYENMLRLIAEGRGVEVERAREWVNRGLYTSEEARKQKIIDKVQTVQELEKQLKDEYGENLTFNKKYGKKKKQEVDLSSPFGVLQFYADLLSGPKTTKSKKDAVAIVYVDGPIMLGSAQESLFGSAAAAYSSPIRKALDEAANDDTVKAVVLRVNSPGGSATASEIILQASKRVAEKKPLIVSMGDVAGSGGYYVALGTETIFADPSTITGSIGVVGGKFATEAMWNKIGINWEPIKRGENASIFGSEDVFSEEERELLQNWMNEIYGVFKEHVVKARGEKLKKEIDKIAGGRVYTGRQAQELGLVDELGGLDAAIVHAAKEAELKDGSYEVRVVPRPKNILEQLFSEMSDKDDDPKRLTVDGVSRARADSSALVKAALPYLENLDPQRVRAVTAALEQMAHLQQQRVLLTMPVIHFRK